MFMLAFWSMLVLGPLQILADCVVPAQPQHPFELAAGLNATVVANGLTSPRGIINDPYGGLSDGDSNTRILIIESGRGITSLSEDSTCPSGWSSVLLAENQDLNHGVELGWSTDLTSPDEPVWLYASSSDELFRYLYYPGNQTVSEAETIINGMANTDHATRTLLLSQNEETGPDGKQHAYIYISRGSQENVDQGAGDVTTGRSQVRRFSLFNHGSASTKKSEPAIRGTIGNGTSVDWMEGELIGWGMRNGVGISFDSNGKLWEVENSADDVSSPQYGDIHFDNPAEELNLLPLPRPDSPCLDPSQEVSCTYYGYPHCFTYWNLSSSAPNATDQKTGQQFAITGSNFTDEQCLDTDTVRAPRLSLQAHSAPLDIKFFGHGGSNRGIPDNGGCGVGKALPCEWVQHAFVSFHGSWDRVPPTGYKVARIPFSTDSTHEPSDDPSSGNGYASLFATPDSQLASCPDGCIRPVGLTFDKGGRLFVSSDASGEIFMIMGEN